MPPARIHVRRAPRLHRGVAAALSLPLVALVWVGALVAIPGLALAGGSEWVRQRLATWAAPEFEVRDDSR